MTDYGDLSVAACRVDPNTSHSERVADVRRVAGQVASYVQKIVAAQQAPLVIGGDCTITLGVVAGFVRSQPDLALLYMDGGLDAVTPAAYRLGRLDSTGLAHLVAEPGCEPTLSEIGSRYPLMAGRTSYRSDMLPVNRLRPKKNPGATRHPRIFRFGSQRGRRTSCDGSSISFGKGSWKSSSSISMSMLSTFLISRPLMSCSPSKG